MWWILANNALFEFYIPSIFKVHSVIVALSTFRECGVNELAHFFLYFLTYIFALKMEWWMLIMVKYSDNGERNFLSIILVRSLKYTLKLWDFTMQLHVYSVVKQIFWCFFLFSWKSQMVSSWRRGDKEILLSLFWGTFSEEMPLKGALPWCS